MRRDRIARFLPTLAVVLTAVTLVALAAGAGSKEDPLVTLSYLEETYTDTLMQKADATLQQRNQELEAALQKKVDGLSASAGSGSASVGYTVVTLTSGQRLEGAVGTEVMLRVGTAMCYATSSPGLVDTTSGATLAGGQGLEKNHLYLMTIEGRAVEATAATVKLLVRGSYTIA